MAQLDLTGIRKRRDRFNNLISGFRAEYFATVRDRGPELSADELEEYRTGLSDLIQAANRAQQALLGACRQHPPQIMPPSTGFDYAAYGRPENSASRPSP